MSMYKFWLLVANIVGAAALLLLIWWIAVGRLPGLAG